MRKLFFLRNVIGPLQPEAGALHLADDLFRGDVPPPGLADRDPFPDRQPAAGLQRGAGAAQQGDRVGEMMV